MTKRHFEMLANVIREHRNSCANDSQMAIIGHLAIEIAARCQQENPNFDTTRFMEACGFPRGS